MNLQRGLAFAAVLLATTCLAQDVEVQRPAKKAKQPTGTITGTVYCGDTNLPAREATIYLLQIAKDANGSRSAGSTDLEGHFAIHHVHEGTYYVVAQLPGYLNPVANLTESRLQAMTDDERKALESRMSAVTISPGESAEVSLRLERAAEIDGTVLYDDGAPGIGLAVVLKPVSKQSDTPAFEQPVLPVASLMDRLGRQTDDRGRFRILGVPPGEYLVSASIPTSNSGPDDANPLVEALQSSGIGALIVYAGNTTRASAAKVIKIESGDASKDADITIPLSKLHTVRGHVVLKSTGQAPPAATVNLKYSDTHELARSAVAPNGEFELNYIAEDNYVLAATAASQPIPTFEVDDDQNEGMGVVASGMSASFLIPRPDKLENAAQVPLAVTGDVDNVTISVPDPKPEPRLPSESTDVEQPPMSAPQ
jgi:hypothetical protein